MKRKKGTSKIEWDELLSRKWWWMGAIFLTAMLMYGRIAPNSPIGYGDSDLFLVMGNEWGVTRAPGYPVYVGLLGLFTNLGLGVAYGGHLLSVVMASLGLMMMFGVGWNLYELTKEKQAGYVLRSEAVERWLLAMLLPMGLGMSSMYWLQAVFAERFMFTGVLVIAIFLVLTEIWKANNIRQTRKWWMVCLLVGIGLSHQWVFGMVAIPILWLMYQERVKIDAQTRYTGAGIMLAAGLIPFLFLGQFAKNQVPYAFVIEPGFGGLVDYVISGYVGDGLVEIAEGAVFPKVVTRLVFANLWQMTKYGLVSLGGWMVLALAFAGLYQYRKRGGQYWLFGFTFRMMVIFALGLALVLPWSIDRLNMAQVGPYLIPMQIMLVVWFWFGWREFVRRFGKALSLLFSKKVVYGILLTILFLPMMLRGVQTGRVSLGSSEVAATIYAETLEQVDPDAMIVCFSYASCYGLIYQQQIGLVRDDVLILPFYWQRGNIVMETDGLTGFNYQSYPWLVLDAVSWNLNDRPVYAVDMFDRYYQFFGVNFGFMNFVPYGYFGKLSTEIPVVEDLPEPEYVATQQLMEQKDNPWNLAEDRLIMDLARKHILNGQVYMKMGLRERAVRELNLASSLVHKFSWEEQDDFLTSRDNVEGIMPSEFFEPGTSIRDVDYILENVETLKESGFMTRALEVAQGAVTVDPKDVRARLIWADLLYQNNNPVRAIEEYTNVLTLDPDNKNAREGIEKVKRGPAEEAETGESTGL